MYLKNSKEKISKFFKHIKIYKLNSYIYKIKIKKLLILFKLLKNNFKKIKIKLQISL